MSNEIEVCGVRLEALRLGWKTAGDEPRLCHKQAEAPTMTNVAIAEHTAATSILSHLVTIDNSTRRIKQNSTLASTMRTSKLR